MKKIPLRMCAVSREKLEKKDLFRIVKNNEGSVFIDDTYKANGRGVYLKKDKDIINKAKQKKSLNFHLKTEVNSDIYDELISKL